MPPHRRSTAAYDPLLVALAARSELAWIRAHQARDLAFQERVDDLNTPEDHPAKHEETRERVWSRHEAKRLKRVALGARDRVVAARLVSVRAARVTSSPVRASSPVRPGPRPVRAR